MRFQVRNEALMEPMVAFVQLDVYLQPLSTLISGHTRDLRDGETVTLQCISKVQLGFKTTLIGLCVLYTVYCTVYSRIHLVGGFYDRIDRELGFFSSRPNWDSPTPSPARWRMCDNKNKTGSFILNTIFSVSQII
jgi:hypothetical protein